MGRIVNNGKSASPVRWSQAARRNGGRSMHRVAIAYRQEDGTTKSIGVMANRKEKIAQLWSDMELVRGHFGSSQSEALRISLHLTANAVRNNRAVPDL